MLRALLEMMLFRRLMGGGRRRGQRGGCLVIPGCGCFTLVILLLLAVFIVTSMSR